MKSSLIYGDLMNDRYARMRLQITASLIIPFIENREVADILDIGCYTGDLLKILPRKVNYFGVDSDAEALKIAQARGAETFRIDLESEDLDFGGRKFDIIVATEVLEHLKDPAKLMSKMRDSAKDKGLILISLPNECTIYHRIKMLCGRGIDGTDFEPHYHLHFPTLKQNDEFVSRYFKIIKKRYWIHVDIGGGMGRILTNLSDKFWLSLANLNPTLFARGVIYLCCLK